ncbi:MAG: 2,3-bisphosphoglycerate-independent phosphoglycerate mutase [Caldiserica bacterium]|jgi:2,3-bisphosphoglycerate-independent phosphoglycerate mutase|nr:2,3-bisphosphoglycerate-independent phosphoglycerate mutase [Caldisericota bacterium]MDH7562739.1 2,3-bisphosphoglycerate-independent phosphoglycerate mutase [Caldisericota bacterium]
MSRKGVLCILDGWGVSDSTLGNAIHVASTPNMDNFLEKFPSTRLLCSGEAVGLPEGQMGNSEVGHLNLGAGRIVYQDFARINISIRNGEFFKNPVLEEAMDIARDRDSSLHLMGLVSDGGVHSHLDHLFALLEMAKSKGLKKVFVHAFLDGRDTPPKMAEVFLRALEEKLKELGIGKIATISGRYYAMDRDKRWERLERAYNALTLGEGEIAGTSLEALENSYNQGIWDEFVLPTVIIEEGEQPVTIQDGDVVIHFNFRADRARELTWALTQEDFQGFPRKKWPRVHYVCMTVFDESLDLPVAFPQHLLKNTLGEVISQLSLPQLRIAETEKYAHVTYFFSGGREEPFPLEDRKLIPSPKVPTYDLKPEMSAFEVLEEVVKRISSKEYYLVVLNFANLDMVGHTGVFEAAVKAAESVDKCLGSLWRCCQENGYFLIITADHGNAEEMIDPRENTCITAHSTNPVPFIYLDDHVEHVKLKERGILADVAPTILKIMGIEKPGEMTGVPLF